MAFVLSFRVACAALVAFATSISISPSSFADQSERTGPPVEQSTPHVRTGFVEIAPGQSLFIDYRLPRDGKPTIVLVNGLTYRTGSGSWEKFANALQAMGFGVLMWDPVGQGQTLLRYGAPKDAVDYRDQVRDMKLLLDKVGLTGPVHLVGLSYGGALAMEFAVTAPTRVASMTLMAPYTAPLESQDILIKMQIAVTRALFPFNPATDSELYDFFLRALVYGTYPSAEPIVLENPYKLEATFRLAQGVRSFLARDYVNALPAGSLHLLIGGRDQYIAPKVLDDFWVSVPEAARMSRIYIEGAEHKIPEAVPEFSAELVRMIVERNERLSGGRTFVASPARGSLRETDGRGRGAEFSTRSAQAGGPQCRNYFARAR